METKDAILQLLQGCSNDIRWYVLNAIRKTEAPPMYVLPESSQDEAREVLGQIREFLLASCQSVAI